MLPNQLRTVIADGNALFLTGIKTIINYSNEYSIVDEADNGKDALDKVIKHQAELVILNSDMPILNGMDVAERLTNRGGGTKIIMFCHYFDKAFLRKGPELGISGFILKDCKVSEFRRCLAAVTSGRSYVSKYCYEYLHTSCLSHQREISEPEHPFTGQLSNAEKKVLKLIAQNKTTKEIAYLLYNSPKTIENHRYHICRKLKLEGKNSLLTFVLKNKYLIDSAITV